VFKTEPMLAYTCVMCQRPTLTLRGLEAVVALPEQKACTDVTRVRSPSRASALTTGKRCIPAERRDRS